MTRTRSLFVLTVAVLLFALGGAGSAVAATTAAPSPKQAKPLVAPAPKASPYRTGDVEVQFWPQADSNVPTQAVVITDVTLPLNTKLPATVRIPIVPGTKVLWAGESIPGGAVDSDPQRQFKEVDGVGGKYAEFVLSKSLRGQLDSIGIPLTFRGDEVAFSSEWVQSTEASSVLITVRFPGGSSRIKISPKPEGSPQTNMAGESLYALSKMKLAPGAKQALKVSFSTNPSGEQAMGSSTKTAIYAVLGALLVAAIALLAFLFVKGGKAGGDGSGDDGSDEGDWVADDAAADDDPFDDLDLPGDSGSRD